MRTKPRHSLERTSEIQPNGSLLSTWNLARHRDDNHTARDPREYTGRAANVTVPGIADGADFPATHYKYCSFSTEHRFTAMEMRPSLRCCGTQSMLSRSSVLSSEITRSPSCNRSSQCTPILSDDSVSTSPCGFGPSHVPPHVPLFSS